MTLSSQTPQRRAAEDHEARCARHYRLREVAGALGVRDFVELRRPHRRKRKSACVALGRQTVIATNGSPFFNGR
jgi:hypothetical protein